jgi:hypothetical protein
MSLCHPLLKPETSIQEYLSFLHPKSNSLPYKPRSKLDKNSIQDLLASSAEGFGLEEIDLRGLHLQSSTQNGTIIPEQREQAKVCLDKFINLRWQSENQLKLL